MRDNQPVSQREFVYPQDYILVSITDADSRIRYCNAAFIEVSGFSEDELLGQPHNIVRHPDMPEEAFRDMWKTIRSGLPWRGLVKNRRRNGDHYWVVANVTPIFEAGRLTGYMSVRTQPTAEQVRDAELLYARMRREKSEGRIRSRLSGGHLQPAGLSGRLASMARLGITGRIVAALVALGAINTVIDVLLPLGTVTGIAMRAVVLTVTTAALAFWLHRTVTKPLSDAAAFARGIAGCDLTGRVDSTRRDEIGGLWAALGQVSVNLRGIVSDVRGSVARVEQSASELAGANQMFAARTEAQASALQESASSLEEMSSAVQNNSDAAQQADSLATGTNDLASRGQQAVGEVVSTMAEISGASKRISDIVQLIDSIAFQTNILALNAAVEAARAGEQGRGFAVVASEVRALAQRSGVAARDIKDLISDSIHKVESGSRGVDAASTRIGEIVGSVDKVSDLIRHIAQASIEQSNGVKQINQAVADLERTTQENSALVEQSTAAARGLADQATRLRGSVQIFRLSA